MMVSGLTPSQEQKLFYRTARALFHMQRYTATYKGKTDTLYVVCPGKRVSYKIKLYKNNKYCNCADATGTDLPLCKHIIWLYLNDRLPDNIQASLHLVYPDLMQELTSIKKIIPFASYIINYVYLRIITQADHIRDVQISDILPTDLSKQLIKIIKKSPEVQEFMYEFLRYLAHHTFDYPRDSALFPPIKKVKECEVK